MEDKLKMVPEVTEDINYWLIKTVNGKYYHPFRKENRITLHHLKQNADDQIDSKKQSQIQNFSNVKLNDMILIPSHFKKQISIGYVDSVGDDPLTRHVTWVKEINFNELDPKCHKFFYKNENIVNLNEVSSSLERLVYPIYKKNEKYYLSLKVNQKSNILFKSIIGLYHLLVEDDHKDDLEIKINLQSPGIIEFISNHFDLILSIIRVLEVVINKKFHNNPHYQTIIENYYKYQIDKLEIDLPSINLNVSEFHEDK